MLKQTLMISENRQSREYHNIPLKTDFRVGRLKFIGEIGEGSFGSVFLAEADGILEDGVTTLVAVKASIGKIVVLLPRWDFVHIFYPSLVLSSFILILIDFDYYNYSYLLIPKKCCCNILPNLNNYTPHEI